MTKTNVMRLLDAAKIPYRAAEYEVDENDLNGMHAAEGIGMPPEQIFKTLVAKGERGGYAVFCIPVCCELDLKKRPRRPTTKNRAHSCQRPAGHDRLYPRRMQPHRHEKAVPDLHRRDGSAL